MMVNYSRITCVFVLLLTLGFVGLAAAQTAGLPIPADFPKDIPIYAGATLTKAGPFLEGQPQLGNAYYFTVAADKDAVIAFYKAELVKKGWKLEKAFSGSPDAFQGVHTDGRMISMGFLVRQSGPKSETTIQLQVMPGR